MNAAWMSLLTTIAALAEPTRVQLREVEAAVARYSDFRVAEREGWRAFGGDEPLMGQHYYPPRDLGYPDLTGSEAQLDFSRPSNLMYTLIDGERVLTGVAFVVRLRTGEAMPPGFEGDQDVWHAHDVYAAVQAATEERPMLRWLVGWWLDREYLSKGDDRGRLAMVHAWVTLPNPDGVFANYNRTVPYLKLGLPVAFADGGSEAAARGLDLATHDGCERATDGRLWIADADRRTRRALRAACEVAAGSVRAALDLGAIDAEALNASAEAAYQEFDAAWTQHLTGLQRARIAAITEHGHDDEHADHGPMP